MIDLYADRRFVAERIRESWDTLRKVPAERVRGYHSAWPDTVQSYFDAYGSGQRRKRLPPATPRAIDRMNETFRWFRFLENQPHLTRAVWITCGCGMGLHRAGAILDIHRNTVARRRDDALDMIADGIRRLALCKN